MLEASYISSKCSKVDVHLRNDLKNQKNLFVFEITAFEFDAGNSAYCDGNTCIRRPMC